MKLRMKSVCRCGAYVHVKVTQAANIVHGEELTPLEMLQERDAVGQLPVHVPRQVPEDIAVIDKLHIAHHREEFVVALLARILAIDMLR